MEFKTGDRVRFKLAFCGGAKGLGVKPDRLEEYRGVVTGYDSEYPEVVHVDWGGKASSQKSGVHEASLEKDAEVK